MSYLWRLALLVLSLASSFGPVTVHNDGLSVTWTENKYGEGYVYTIDWSDYVPDRSLEVTPTATETPVALLPELSIKDRIRKRFGVYAEKAIRIAGCETGHTFDPHATGRAGEIGLYQIHPIHTTWINRLGYSFYDLYDPDINIEIAYQLSKGGTDWSHWTCNAYT